MSSSDNDVKNKTSQFVENGFIVPGIKCQVKWKSGRCR